MATQVPGTSARFLHLGTRVAKSTGTLAATTVDLFIIAGGEVLLTSMYGLVTTTITVANSYYLKVTPTTGDATQLCVATDIGTTDTAAGGILGFGVSTTTAPPKLASPSGASNVSVSPFCLPPAVISTGKIQSVSAGTDGVITWVVTYVPLTDGASLVAA
jgi:hypothetical protein